MRSQTVPAAASNEDFRCSLHPPLLPRIDRGEATAVAIPLHRCAPRLDLDKVEMITAARDQIDLAMPHAQTSAQYTVSSVLKEARSNALAEPPKSGPAVRRRRHRG